VAKREERNIRFKFRRCLKGQSCDVKRRNREVDDKKGEVIEHRDKSGIEAKRVSEDKRKGGPQNVHNHAWG
jgi:hypothetical protein